jgi:hypothetical protein
VTAQDHNKTLVIVHSALGAFFTIGLIAAPWIIAQNFRRREQIPTAIIIFGIVLFLAVLLWSSAIAMHRRKPVGRKLAMISAVAVLPIFWPAGVYAWWFLHSEGAKQIYRVTQE